MRRLGKITIEISMDRKGNIDAKHNTEFENHLQEMQGAMNRHDKAIAVALRKKACSAAAAFFLFIENPDEHRDVEPR